MIKYGIKSHLKALATKDPTEFCDHREKLKVHPRPPIKLHLKEADGIRGLACLIVLVIHTTAINFPGTYPYLVGTAKIGLWLFFCLSSFLLTYQLLLRGLSVMTIIDFFIGRTIRIYPLFALSVFAYYVFGTAGVNTANDIFKALTFQQGYAHLWTIPVEFKFYFILPVIVFFGVFIQSRFGLKGLLFVAVLLTLVHQVFAPYWLLQAGSIDTFQYLPAFLFGTIAAFLSLNNIECWILKRGNIVGIVVLICFFLSSPFVRYFVLGEPPSDYLVNKYIYFSLGWAVFIFTQTHSPTILGPILSSRLFSSIGRCSYSTYLIHWLILIKITSYYPKNIIAAVAVIFLSLLSGYFSYSFFEKPLFSLRRNFVIAIFHILPNSLENLQPLEKVKHRQLP